MTDRVEMGFSKDYTRVILFNYENGSDGYIHELEPMSGTEITRRRFQYMDYEEREAMFEKLVAVYFDLFPTFSHAASIESPDGEFVLVGNRAFGSIALRSNRTNSVIREFRFASDVE